MTKLKTPEDFRQEIADKRAEGEAILALAESEDREVTKEENEAFETICDEIQNLQQGEAQAKKREDFRKQAAAAAEIQNRIDSGQLEFGDEGSRPAVSVPARARASRNLVAFDDERDAYVAGTAFLAGILNNKPAIDRCKSWGIYNTLTEGIGSKGGFLVPEEMERSMVRLREERGVFTRYARSYPMASDSVFVPRDINDVTAYWMAEAAEITASDNDPGAAELIAKKLACLTKVSTELDEDSVVDIGEMVTRSMAYAMADKIDEAGFNGDGTSTYGGVTGLASALNSNAINDAASGNVGATTLDIEDFENTVALYPQYPGASPRWFVNSAVYWASMARMQLAAGGNTVQDIGNGPEQVFLGYPVTFTQVLTSTTGTAASTILAYFGDLSLGATVGVRRGMTTQVSVDRYFENDLIGIKCTERVAINVHERGDTVRTRPIVALKTAAS